MGLSLDQCQCQCQRYHFGGEDLIMPHLIERFGEDIVATVEEMLGYTDKRYVRQSTRFFIRY